MDKIKDQLVVLKVFKGALNWLFDEFEFWTPNLDFQKLRFSQV